MPIGKKYSEEGMTDKMVVYTISIPGSPKAVFTCMETAVAEVAMLLTEGVRNVDVQMKEMTPEEYEALREFDGY